MSDRVITDLPLELHLEKLSTSQKSSFPDLNMDYFGKYCEIKRFLAKNYYKSTSAGLAREGERYTLHTIEHVNDVIRQAGHLVGIELDHNSRAIERMQPYEVFVFLLAILLHDAGNASRRQDHEKAPFAILNDMDSHSGLEAIERRLVASIAQAHGGRAPNGDKDTITGIIREEKFNIGNCLVHGRRLAALVRLADELSENPQRADPEAVRKTFVSNPALADPPVSVIHNLFCKLINIHVDPKGGQISLRFEIEKDYLNIRYPIRINGKDETIYLVDYIANRVEKMECERRYCNRFLWDFVPIDRCRVTLHVFDRAAEITSVGSELSDTGYPDLSPSLKKREPRFDGEALMKECFSDGVDA
jgi:hypothetical protein